MPVDRSSPEKVVASYCAAMFAIDKAYHDQPEAQRTTEESFSALRERSMQVNADHCTRPHSSTPLGWPSPYDSKITNVKRLSEERAEVHTLHAHPHSEHFNHHGRYTVDRKSDGWRISAEDAIDDTDGVVFDWWRDVDPRIGQLFDEHLGAFFDKQDRLLELVGEDDWSYDPHSGMLNFGDRYAWHAQILGSESRSHFTWRWSWANEASGLPERITQYARAVRAFGEKHGLIDFTTPSFPYGVLGGWKLLMIGCGLAKAPAAFRAPQNDNLTVFTLIDDPGFPSLKPSKAELGLRIAKIFPQVVEQAEQHPRAFGGYLRYYGLRPEIEKLTMRGMRGDEAVVTARFDEKKRLVNLVA
jgi:hypothetical protein